MDIYTVICFVLVSAKFGSYTVVSVNRTLFEAKMCTYTLESMHFTSTSVPFTLMTVQVSNLVLAHTKRITVCTQKSPKAGQRPEFYLWLPG
jgi:hypothetical protein